MLFRSSVVSIKGRSINCRSTVVSFGKTLYGTFPVWRSWQAVENFSHISIKSNKNKPDSTDLDIFGNRSGWFVALRRFFASQKDKCRDEIEALSSQS